MSVFFITSALGLFRPGDREKMDDVPGTETSQDFMDFVEHISRDVKQKDGLLIGSIAELPMQYVISRMEDISVDSLQFSRYECAVQVGDAPPKNFNGTIFVVEPAYARPGYARLRKPDCRVGASRDTRYLSFNEMTATAHRITKKSKSYQEETLLDFIGMENTGKHQHSLGQNLFGLNGTKLNIQGAITCLSWPQEAAAWKTRQRAHGWPAQDLLENVVNGGCHLVVFQSPSFSPDSTVFRFSFASAEVALIYTWTPIQKYIYHVLRLIKDDVVRQLELQGHRNIMNAYHFKTLMLWACETKPPAFWDESRVKSSVGELLCEMIEFLVDRNCPNYFMPSVNLMDHLPESLDVDTIIMPLLVFKEQGAARLISTVPMANAHSTTTTQVNKKLINLGQMGLRSVNNYAGYRRSKARFCEGPTKMKLTYPMEFNSLFNGVSAHLRLATNPNRSRDAAVVRTHQSDYEIAVINLEQAMLVEVRAYTQRQISLGDALPEIFSSIFFADESNPEISLRSGNILPDIKNTSSSKGDTSNHDTIPKSQSELSRHQASCMARETARDGAEDDFVKISSLSPELSEQGLKKIEKRGPTEKEPVHSSQQLALTLAINIIVPAFDVMFPKASCFVSAAYRANFFYSYCHDYQLALQVCEESLRHFRAIKMSSAGTYIHDVCSVALTPKWMPIFDKHIQAVYGFVALSNSLNRIGRKRSPTERVTECRSSAASDFRKDAPTHYLSPLEFLDYIKMQCETKLLPSFGSSQRLFSYWCTIAERSRFILLAAFSISRTPAWNPYPTHCNWYK